MVYSIKTKKRDYKEEELKAFVKQYKGRRIPASAYIIEGGRVAFDEPRLTHRKGTLVKYKGKMYAVDKVISKGVFLQPITEEEGLKDDVIKRKLFVKEKDYSMKATPYFSDLPIYFSPIILGEKPRVLAREEIKT